MNPNVYLDTGDRVVVRDHPEHPRRVGPSRLAVIVNDQVLILSKSQANLVYEGLQRALRERGFLDEHNDLIEPS